ncbi:MAG: hypothetical protein ABIR19_03970 [Ginsengibacter sp.]
MNNGLLPLQVTDEFLEKIFKLDRNSKLTVDVDKQTITIDATGEFEKFNINSYKKTCLLNGFDDIDYLLSNLKEIRAFESTLDD